MGSPASRAGEEALHDLADQGYERFMQALTLLVEPFGHRLPSPADAALAQARRVWLDRAADPHSLLEHQLACWTFLHNKGRGSVPKDDEDYAIRAVLCCLYLDDEGDLGMSVEFASDMLRHLGVEESAIVSTVLEISGT